MYHVEGAYDYHDIRVISSHSGLQRIKLRVEPLFLPWQLASRMSTQIVQICDWPYLGNAVTGLYHAYCLYNWNEKEMHTPLSMASLFITLASPSLDPKGCCKIQHARMNSRQTMGMSTIQLPQS